MPATDAKEHPANASLSGQITLPLLAALPPETSTPIIHTLLKHCAAQRTIRTFIVKHLRRKNQKSNHKKEHDEQDSNANAAISSRQRTCRTIRAVPASRNHFILEALQSNSLPIRQNASLQLLTAADTPGRIEVLTTVLWEMIQDESERFLGESYDPQSQRRNSNSSADSTDIPWDIGSPDHNDDAYSHTHTTDNNTATGECECSGGEAIVQLYGLMVHYVTGSDERFYPFLIKGGLDWICEQILGLINLLMITKDVKNDLDGGTAGAGVRHHGHGHGIRAAAAAVSDQEGQGGEQGNNSSTPSSKNKINPSVTMPTFASPSIHKPRHYFTTVSQSRSLDFHLASEEEIKKRLSVLVDFCLRVTVLAEEKFKKRHEAVHNWFWRREKKITSRIGLEHGTAAANAVAVAAATGLQVHGSSTGAGHFMSHEGQGSMSPLGCLLAASFVLRKTDFVPSSPSSGGTTAGGSTGAVLTGEDYILKPEKRIDRINWMLSKMVDINGEVLVVSEEDEFAGNSGKPPLAARRRGGPSLRDNYRKRKRSEGSASRENDASATAASGPAERDNPSDRLLSQMFKRQRGGETSENPTSRAIQRVAGMRSGEIGASDTIEGFASAADVLARGSLSIFDRGESAHGDRPERSVVSRLLSPSLRRFLGSASGGGGDENGDNDNNGDDDDGDDESENDDNDIAPFHAQVADEEADSDADMEDSEQQGNEVDMEDDEEVESDEDGEEEDIEECHMLDNIIVDVGSNPFQDDNLMMIDALENIRSSLSQTRRSIGDAPRQKRSTSEGSSPGADLSQRCKDWRSKAYVRAGLEVLAAQHPTNHHTEEGALLRRNNATKFPANSILTPSAEQGLLKSMCDIVKPPKKPLKLKVFMRRAPTQEEFFRGSLSRNPMLISSLKASAPSSTSSENDPTVKDLRLQIANDLQMTDSAELLELLVASKILDMNLKLRVIAQTTWKTHVMENTSAVHSESSFRQFMSGSSFGDSGILSRARFDENTPMSALPPMVVTYRLAGIDGEATEDKIEEGDLVDPDAPPDTNASTTQYELKMEKEFGITRLITKGRGVNILLRSLEGHLGQVMKRIRRDDVGRRSMIGIKRIDRKNPSRALFLKTPPCAALILLQHCAMIAENRKKLVNAQAPTVLLRLLLDVLNSIDQTPKKKNSTPANSNDNIGEDDGKSSSEGPSQNVQTIGNHPTANALQALIETLSSDISAELSKKPTLSREDAENSETSDSEGEGPSTLPMLLSSLRTTSLSPPLRRVIAKLLPFLTYGQLPQSRALASHFISHIQVEYLGTDSSLYNESDTDNKAILMETFVDAAIHLPPVAVCDTLRSELIRQGFVSLIKNHILAKVPSNPTPWTPALFSKEEKLSSSEKDRIRGQWKAYFSRNGLQTAFQILIGLSTEHNETQSYLADEVSVGKGTAFVNIAHWIESTSDKDEISTNGLGILAETLLDTMLSENMLVKEKIDVLRKKTRDRKKELAQERRMITLSKMGGFGHLPGGGASTTTEIASKSKSKAPGSKKKAGSTAKSGSTAADKPAWMLEMEAMEDESGLACAICQEGRSYQPSEMLGMYAFLKKITIPHNKGGSRGSTDGALMILSLPLRLPDSLQGSEADDEWYQPSMDLSTTLKSTSHGASTIAAAASSVIGSRSCNFITTVTAGNSIHCSCHARARTTDRNHPKAPKSEWEGASLRNSRVSCNVILPLMSKENAKVPVMEMENALADYQQAVANMLGSKPKSMLWTVLQDVRLLMLRISYGESLNADCGGGSLSSNSMLIFHSLFLADMFGKDAEHDLPVTVRHAKSLSTGYLASSSILRCSDLLETSKVKQLRRAFADAGPMAAICCILFQNIVNDEDVSASNANILSSENAPSVPPPKRRWEMHKDHFLMGLLQCAGRRHALDIDGSGCEQASSGRRNRSTSLSEWNEEHISPPLRCPVGKQSGVTVEEYSKPLRPMLLLYATLDQLSKLFTLQMDDENIEKCSQQLVSTIESCQKAANIRSLIALCNVSLDDTTIIEAFEAGAGTV